MRTIAIAMTLAMTAGAAVAQSNAVSTTNQGAQNAVSNQQAHDPLSGGGSGALGAAAHNATSAQNASTVTLQASTTQGVSLLYGVDTASTAVGISQILDAAKAKTPAQPFAEAKPKP